MVRPAFVLLPLALVSCGGVQRFPLRDPIWKDTDTRGFQAPCKDDPEEKGHKICMPEAYESPFLWDGANNIAFRPVSRFFAVDPAGESANVNSMDEVADSSWFTNRIGRAPMSAAELVSGPCGAKVLDPDAPDGSWLVDQGKPNGANPGFRVKVEGIGKFMLKADPSDQPERATGATSIAARLYHAAGWFAPCDSVVYLRPSILKLKPGLKFADNSGVVRQFDEKALENVLSKASHRGELVRMVASRWLPGRTLGPFRYDGTRDDDPNDVIAHEDRRDLRGARVISAWLNHFDSREQNSMDTWMADNPKDPDSSPGHIQHWYIDLGDCFGSEWEIDGISRRLGHAYYLDFKEVGQDLVTFGVPTRPWDRAERSKQAPLFGYFHSRDFEPDEWKGGYPNPAFGRMSERDGAWAARTIARFSPELVEAAVRAGDYTNEEHTRFLIDRLLERQKLILQRYFEVLSPIADVKASGAELCGVDLARRTKSFPDNAFKYGAAVHVDADGFDDPKARPSVRPAPDGGVCVTLGHVADDGGAPDDAASRYVIVDVSNGQSEGPLRAHLYDLGPKRGFKLVGIERPDDDDPPG